MSDAQAALADAADAGIHRLAIPTPFQVGRVNTYLIEDDPLTLVDSGPNSGTALDALERALAAHRRRVEDLELIVISHQHMDHLGLVSILARRSGAQVAALDLLAPRVERWQEGMDADDAFAEHVMGEHGIPRDVRYALVAVSQSYRAWGASATVTRRLAPGSELVLRDRTLRVLHRPGHSPSDTIFHDERRGIVLGGDHLIKHVSSNPLIARPLHDGAAPAATRRRSAPTRWRSTSNRCAPRARCATSSSSWPATATPSPITSRSSTSACGCTRGARRRSAGCWPSDR